jgi:amino-acid N-acetyltransferase
LLKAVCGALRHQPLLVGFIAGVDKADTAAFAQQLAARLRTYKLVIIESQGGIVDINGQPLSFMDESMLAALLNTGEAEWAGLAERRLTLQAVRAALLGGVGSVNLCTLPGTARELFTYEGSGTLFTLADYCTVQKLGIDDFEQVERLIARGQREGLLKRRSTDEIAGLLLDAYGATIGAHHLAGICALTSEPYRTAGAGEITGLYTITRFKGEGVGARLMARLLTDARAAGLAYVFACTTKAHAQAFFERHGFRRVGHDQVPAAKWIGYDPRRKQRVAVYRLDLANERGPSPTPLECAGLRTLGVSGA